MNRKTIAGGAVLLKNDGVLPFGKGIRRIAWFGDGVLSKEQLEQTTADAAVYVLAELSEQDRQNIRLLARFFPRLVLILTTDIPLDLSSIEELPGGILLVGPTDGENRMEVESLLFGRTVPSGKLTETWKQSEPQPDYPFGFGLSYTRFDVRTDIVQQSGTKISLYLTVSNIGEHSGQEVVQIYVDRSFAEAQRTPLLKPGAIYKMAMSFSVESLAAYQRKEKYWELPAGDYMVCVGTSSANTVPEAIIRIPQEVILGKIRTGPPANRPEEEETELPVFILNPQLFRSVTGPGENSFYKGEKRR